MILHLTFSDGSNPYVAFGDKAKVTKELRKWKKKYDITVTEKDDYIDGYVHIPKATDLFAW